ncbi:MAG: type II toxin-antitoxin system VapC family toxin [Acidobacteria bacterium]|nr:type II toxin-antitoxin system VapC family toxin [Acidobacteriota bacterium]
MKVVDLNLLLYAVNADAPHHERARAWWEAALAGDEQVGLAWPVVLGFLRLSTRAGIMPRPLTTRQAVDVVQEWVDHSQIVLLHPGAGHWSVLRGLLESAGTAGNLTTDAHLAALALEYGATLCSTDTDFSKFKGLKFVNPLA